MKVQSLERSALPRPLIRQVSREPPKSEVPGMMVSTTTIMSTHKFECALLLKISIRYEAATRTRLIFIVIVGVSVCHHWHDGSNNDFRFTIHTSNLTFVSLYVKLIAILYYFHVFFLGLKPNSMVQANAVGALIEYGNEAGANVANISGKNKGSEQEGKRSHDSSDDSNKDADKERLEPEGGLQMISEEGNGNDENNDQSKRWMEFVDVVETKAIPNLEAYSNAKAIRTETSIRFVNSIDACIQTLHDTIDGVLSDVVEPICNQYSEGFNDTEDNIITTMVSNHSRRNKLLELMHNADAAWSINYNKLTSEIMGDVSNVTKKWHDINFGFLLLLILYLSSCLLVFVISKLESSRSKK